MSPTGETAGMDVTAVADRLRAAGCVFAEEEARLLIDAAATPERLTAMVGERVSGVPLEYILGWAEFCGLRIRLLRGVFVPRRRTELLVREAIAICPPGAVVVDVCCGSGAVGAALIAGSRAIDVHAVDIDPIAVRCARANLAGAAVYQGDLFEPLPEALRGRVDLIAANAPYVPSHAFELLPPEAREHEPSSALDGGGDGLVIVRRIVAAAPSWLRAGGHLLVETSEAQVVALAEALRGSGLTIRVAEDRELHGTVAIGRLR
jgi:release factor glutamine methyltransferase